MGVREIRLSRIHQTWIYVTFGILFVSGVVWILDRYGAAGEELLPSSGSQLSTYSLKIHGAAAMVFLVILGTLIPGHMLGGWKARKNLLTGLSMVFVNLILIFTAYALYYSGSDELRSVSSWMHIALGLLVAPLFAWHAYKHP